MATAIHRTNGVIMVSGDEYEDTTDKSPREDTTDKSPREDTTDKSPREDTTDKSPRETR